MLFFFIVLFKSVSVVVVLCVLIIFSFIFFKMCVIELLIVGVGVSDKLIILKGMFSFLEVIWLMS